MIRLGAVADDVTGACDLAGRVVEAGLPATVLLGTPSEAADLFAADGPACAVVALKIRTAPVAEAVTAATGAAHLLRRSGATLLYQKYCSTFDSTPSGNIGPIADALTAVAGSDGSPAVTIGTPATPGSGRTQYQGTLFVDGVPLAESPMRDHPLTPMRDSDLGRLLQPQTPRPVGLVRWQEVQQGADAVAAAVADGHTLVDALTEDDLDVIARAVLRTAEVQAVVAGGGAGVAAALARAARREAGGAQRVASATPDEKGLEPRPTTVPVTGRLILAGSASAATRGQVAAFHGERHVLDPSDLARDPAALHRVRDALAARENPLVPVLIHASAEVAAAQRELGADRAAGLVEAALSELAAFAVQELDYSHLIVAGGETSGAVTARLGIDRLRVGAQAAPGVPWAVADSGDRRIAVLLKSGNFGDPGLFSDAWEVAP